MLGLFRVVLFFLEKVKEGKRVRISRVFVIEWF